MAHPNASRTLQARLPDRQRQLQIWAADGRLTAAAQEALLLQEEPRALRRLVKRWAAGDFRDLPPVVLLSASDMPGAIGSWSYAISTTRTNADGISATPRELASQVIKQ